MCRCASSTIADKPLFALIARPSINSVEKVAKLIGISSSAQHGHLRALLRRFG
jgi:hypothetical protein